MKTAQLWRRYQQYFCHVPPLGLTLDVSRMRFDVNFLDQMAPAMRKSFESMDALERGAKANPDENRMVGHYWLRTPDLAPSREIASEIRKTVEDVKTFAAKVHNGGIRPPSAARFTRVLLIGIGGSALGPMFVADALGNPASDPMKLDFIDNTDPDGIARTLEVLAGRFAETLCIVTSKSGGTPETRNGMLLVAEAYRASTGTKDPAASDVLYVKSLAAPFTVNTMPEGTLKALADHGEITTLLRADGGDCEEVLARFAAAGIDIYALATQLQQEGAKAFVKSWNELMTVIASKSTALQTGRQRPMKSTHHARS